ncbi:SgcJ/EcaC family oxidoreductase [Denitrobaculum tricleocarpae]|uniref:SgcJ/EcaC family oxidoreductase n=2 Tax=Denitrobaculum tricleocarpae TaxID=2591009 RepID=A0A545TN62_9PROT|nr:SgcJ/EcaC family oxidoreductase [Denitrobaculum tricleocarpae]
MADGHSATKAAIEAVDAEFEAALSAGSASRLAGVYTENGQALPPNGPIVSGRKALEVFWQGAVDAGLASVELETVELEDFGDSAVQVGRYTLKAADGTTADVGKLMILWKKEDGEWRWHRDIWNSSNPAK